MKRIKRNLILLSSIPALFLGACNKGGSSQDTAKNCPKCEEPKTVETTSAGTTLNVTYDNGDQVSDKLHLLYDANLEDGTTKKLKATFNQEGEKIKFSSSDEKVASVTSDGLITALKADAYCKITVSAGKFKRVFDLYTYNKTRFFGISSGEVTNIVDKEIESITLPSGATKVTNDAVVYLTRLKRLIITEGYTNFVGSDYCVLPPNVEYIYIPSTLERLQSEFWVTPKLKRVEVHENNQFYKVYDNKFVYKIAGHRANYIVRGLEGFDGNLTDEIKTATNDVVTTVGGFSCIGLNTVKDLVINPNVSYPRYYLYGSSSVETVSLPKSKVENTTISNLVDLTKLFTMTPNLREIKLYDDSTGDPITSAGNCSIIDGNLYYNDNGNLTLALGTSNGLIASGTKKIYNFAFSGRNFVNRKLKVPSSVTTIGEDSFIYTNLEKLYLPSQTTSFLVDSVGFMDYGSNQFSNPVAFFYFTMYKDGKLLIPSGSSPDNVTYNAIGGKFTPFFGANENMTIYDGSETSRYSNNLITLKGKGYEKFAYQFNVTEEQFDAL